MQIMTPFDSEHLEAIVIGGGQAGLSASRLLDQGGIQHVVLEKHRIAHAWRSQRWDNFCLVTPNWQCQLPGFSYDGDDPKGFMLKDEIVDYIERFAESFDANVQEGVAVRRLAPLPNGGFEVLTNHGRLTADHVVVAIGGYHDEIVPPTANTLPPHIHQLHSVNYRNAESLPDGGVLVVGSGQSGTQIAEDLHLGGREVHLCVGNAPRVNRRYRGKDVVEWLDEMGYYDLPFDEHPQGDRVRAKTNHYVTGRDGGRDIDLRMRALEGMKLYGKLESVSGTFISLAPDLSDNLDQADATAQRIRDTIDEHIGKHQIDAPVEAPYTPPWAPEDEVVELDLDAAGISTVIWSIGFKPNFRWINADLLDERGYPRHHRGVTDIKGLYFLGLPWQHTWGSGRFSGVARDAEYLVEHIAAKKPAVAST
ncbi:MAG: MSMEG_0569 family flavin-dependent oxidoreductase [Planctomycetota bacterium]